MDGERTARPVATKYSLTCGVVVATAFAACSPGRTAHPEPVSPTVQVTRGDTIEIYSVAARALQDSAARRSWVLGRTEVRRGRVVPSDSVMAVLVARGVFAGSCILEPNFLNCADDRWQIRFGRMERGPSGNLLLHASRYTGRRSAENGAEITLFDVEVRGDGGGVWSVVAVHYAGAT